jgi:predicted permease
MLPPDASDSLTFTLNSGAVWFTAGLSILTGFLFGMFPALHSTRPELISTLRSGTGKMSGTRGAARFRTTLVTSQIALSTALLICAGLFIKSLRNVSRVDLGVKIDNVSTFAVSPQLSGYDSVRTMQLYARIEEELRALPGVTTVSSALVPLLGGSSWGSDVAVEGFRKGPDTDANARYNELGTGFFETVGMQRLAGRDFTLSDSRGAPKVAIVNEAFARKFGLLGRKGSAGPGPLSVIGKRIGAFGKSDTLNIEIVGLVRNAGYADVKDSVPPLFFIPWRQDSRINSLNFYVASSLPPEQILAQIPRLMKKIDPLIPVEGLKSMPQQVRENIFLDRMISILSAGFGTLATILAAIGLYGVLAYSVAQRTNEIGIRVALGADAGRIRRMILRQVLAMTAIGGVIGIFGAWAAGRQAGSLLYEMKGFDPFVFVVATALLVFVSLLAGLLPAQRASKVDPIQALKYD